MFLRETEWIGYLSHRGNFKNKIWERKQNTERVREIRVHHEKTLVKKLRIQTGVEKTCSSSTKRSSEINNKPGHWMEEKWEIRCWNRGKIIVSRNSSWMQERGISWYNSRQEVAIFWVSQAMLLYVLLDITDSSLNKEDNYLHILDAYCCIGFCNTAYPYTNVCAHFSILF